MAIQVANTSSQLTGKTIVLTDSNETISGVKTFSGAPVFSAKPLVNAGLQFPATQAASADPNCLDDFEEGIFTPTIISTGGGSPTYSVQHGAYVKVGRGVWFQIHITLATFGTLAAGTITIGTLPFTVGSFASWVSVSYFGGLVTSMSYVGGALNASATAVAMTYIPAVGSGSHSLLAKSDLGSATDIVLGGFYLV